MKRHLTRGLLAAALSVCAATTALHAGPILEEKVVVEPETKVDFGKINVNIRLRYEYADQEGPLRPSNAWTGRIRLGYTTPVLWGIQGMAEFEGNGTPDEYTYRAANISGPANRTNVPDAESAELNQLWLSYKAFETMAKVGRQRIIYDNARFVGNVGWRQNEQTYDAALFESKTVPGLTLGFSYIEYVQRFFGSESFGPTADFESDSYVVNINYKFADWLKVTAYSYMLDLENDVVTFGSKTFGGFATGEFKFSDTASLAYRAEYANQSDWRGSAPYHANYVHANLKGTLDKYSLEAGFELLGTDDGNAAVQTPLGTNHAFNGWADQFLVTPNSGLRDYYAGFTAKLPCKIGAGVYYHYFTNDDGGDEFGQEIDAVLSKDIGYGFSVLTKFAYYFGDGDASPAAFQQDTVRAWLQVEYNF